MTPEQRAREFVEVGFRDLGVPSLEPYINIIADLIAGAETDLRAEIEQLKIENNDRVTRLLTQIIAMRGEIERLTAGLQMLAKQEYDAGYTPEGFTEAILSGDEP